MKVLDLRCQNAHVFEGWFASDDDFKSQNERGLIECPLCADRQVVRTPTAPRLNLSAARGSDASREERSASAGVGPRTGAGSTVTSRHPATGMTGQNAAASMAGSPDLQNAWVAAVRDLMARTEDVGTRFAEEARRIHYGESPDRGIRGKASAEDRAALQDEGIETMAIPVPRALEGPLQ